MTPTLNQASRKIGDALVSPIGFGAMGISLSYTDAPVNGDEERFQVLDAAYEQGCTHWDTADVYGDSEELIGKWFKRTGKRNEIFLASKCGFTFNPETGPAARGDPEYVKEAANRSLERLGVDMIDLYYVHRVDPKVPIEITIGAMAELVKEGKVKYIGISECTAKDLRRAHAVHPISAIQMEVSPFSLELFDPDLAMLETARELGVTIVVYSPLGRGLLTGQIKSFDDLDPADYRRTIPKFSDKNFPKILEIVSQIQEIATKHNATPGQATLAWILGQGDDFVAIPGTKKVKYVEENAVAAAVKLNPEEIATITRTAKNADLRGERYGGVFLEMVHAETPPL